MISRRLLPIVFGAGMLVVSVGPPAAACSSGPPERMGLVLGSLRGEDVEWENLGNNQGVVVTVWKDETVQTWDAVGDYGPASVSTITEYWGEPPDEKWTTPTFRGGHLVGVSATSTSCGDDPALQIGDSDYAVGIYFASSDSTIGLLIGPQPTKKQLSALTELLGQPTAIPPPGFPLEHPTAAVPENRASDSGVEATEITTAAAIESGRPSSLAVVASIAAVVVGGFAIGLLARRNSDPDQ